MLNICKMGYVTQLFYFFLGTCAVFTRLLSRTGDSAARKKVWFYCERSEKFLCVLFFFFLNAASKPGELEISTFTKKIDRSSEGYGESLVYLVLFSFIRSTGSKHHYSDKDDFESESKEKRHRRKRSRSRSRDRDRRSRSRDKRSRSRDRERRHRRWGGKNLYVADLFLLDVFCPKKNLTTPRREVIAKECRWW